MKCCLPIRTIEPNPDEHLAEQLPFTVLGINSPLSYRKAARLLAEDFASYTHFSPAPYEADEIKNYGKSYARDRALLFGEPIDLKRVRFFGAIGMRWKKYDDMPEGWFMTWVWFHPSEQKKGHLTNAWPHILRLFPNFFPDPPITPAMQSFLKKIQFRHPFMQESILTLDGFVGS